MAAEKSWTMKMCVNADVVKMLMSKILLFLSRSQHHMTDTGKFAVMSMSLCVSDDLYIEYNMCIRCSLS